MLCLIFFCIPFFRWFYSAPFHSILSYPSPNSFSYFIAIHDSFLIYSDQALSYYYHSKFSTMQFSPSQSYYVRAFTLRSLTYPALMVLSYSVHSKYILFYCFVFHSIPFFISYLIHSIFFIHQFIFLFIYCF